MSTVSNLFNGVLKKAKKAFENKYERVGVSWLQARRLKNLPEKGHFTISLFNKPIQFVNRIELINTIEEIFIKESYKTTFDTDQPFIIDCGANIGLSIIYFKKLYPSAKIVAFEPDSTNFNLLSANLKSLDVLKNVEIKKQAVWKENTTLSFISDGSMTSRIDNPDHSESIDTDGRTTIDAVRLRDLLTTKVDLLKMDIEGAEYEVLIDIEDKLHLIDQLFFEYHGLFDENHKLEELLQLLSRNKFRYYIESGPIYQTPFYRPERNGIFDIQLNIYAFR